jgi:hypothetical protein
MLLTDLGPALTWSLRCTAKGEGGWVGELVVVRREDEELVMRERWRLFCSEAQVGICRASVLTLRARLCVEEKEEEEEEEEEDGEEVFGR